MIFRYQARRNAVKLEGERSAALDLARGRVVLLSAFFVFVYIMLLARAFDLGVIQANSSPSAPDPETHQSAQAPVPALKMRGDIMDRNGVLLATTLKSTALYADPRRISDPKSTAQQLAAIFPDLPYGETLQKLQSGKRFVWIKRSITPREQAAVLKIGQPGLAFQSETKRFYPQGHLAAHLTGYVDIDSEGLAGTERSFNAYLDRGQDLTLTLDIRLQHSLRRALQSAVQDYSALGGVGVIMDAATGEVLAGVSLPDFDPYSPGNAKPEQVFNRLTLGAYELGSVFKIFSTAAFLETHDVPMSTSFDATRPLQEGRFVIHDYHAQKRRLTIPEIFMHSSNIGSALMGQAVGGESLRNFYKDLGLLSPLDFEIREVARPLVPDPWRDINTLTAAYGHGIATTPLQVAAGVASIVNGGLLVRPTLVLSDKKESAEPSVRIVSAPTAQRLRQLMRLVVTDGTGMNADVPGFRVGGKTGTAEKIGPHGYDQNRLISSFIGAFPMDNPRYVVFIAVDEPKGTKKSFGYATGGWVAAPAVAQVIVSMVSILGLPAQDVADGGDLASPLRKYVSLKAQE